MYVVGQDKYILLIASAGFQSELQLVLIFRRHFSSRENSKTSVSG